MSAPADALPSRSTAHKNTPVPLVGLAVLLLAGAAYFGYAHLRGLDHIKTDDAYVNGNLVRLTPQVAGTVIAIHTDETQWVQQRQVLIELDPRDAAISLAQAKAALGETVREVAQLFANQQRNAAAMAMQRTQLVQAAQDLDRDQSLQAIHGVSEEVLQHDRHAVGSASAGFQQAAANLAAARAAVSGTTASNHPRVLQAEAALRAAWLTAARTRIVAPISGYVVRRTVQLGQQVAPGGELLAIVPLDAMWVDANFKENQLRGLRLGQPATVVADMYGSRFAYHGTVLGLHPGTGSALAVLPAQNASGNWIKIVQRVSVRIGLDPAELAAHPLLLGLSTAVEVDTHDGGGRILAQLPTWPSTQNTTAFAAQDSGVEEEIQRIVAGSLAKVEHGTRTAAPRGAL